jgi:hypothetical protein
MYSIVVGMQQTLDNPLTPTEWRTDVNRLRTEINTWRKMLLTELEKPSTCESDAPTVGLNYRYTNAKSNSNTEPQSQDAKTDAPNTATGMPSLLALSYQWMETLSALMEKEETPTDATITISSGPERTYWRLEILSGGRSVSVSSQI